MEINEPVLFSSRDIAEIYPLNLGLQNTLKHFITQMKIRPSKYGMVRVNNHSSQIRVAFYNANKLKKHIESYIANSDYRLSKERKANLATILKLIDKKLNK